MNVTVDNVTFVDNRSLEQDFGEQQWLNRNTKIIFWVASALGIPGNILSAVVWLRHHMASEGASVFCMYLATLSINDLVCLLFIVAFSLACNSGSENWRCGFLHRSLWSAASLEPLLLLSISVVRLIAIRRPLQVDIGFVLSRISHKQETVLKRSQHQFKFSELMVDRKG